MGITAIDRFVVQLERQLWRDESDYLDVDGYTGILRACAFSRESTVSLIRNELLGVSSTPENEGDSAIITSLLHIIRSILLNGRRHIRSFAKSSGAIPLIVPFKKGERKKIRLNQLCRQPAVWIVYCFNRPSLRQFGTRSSSQTL